MSHDFLPQQAASQTSSEVVQEILRAISQLRYGSVEITVHEGKVTQIERREKVRFAPTSNSPANSKDKPTVSTVATS
jgi:hypothetical protein